MKRSLTYKYNFTQNNQLKKTVNETYMRSSMPCGFSCCTSNAFLPSNGYIFIPTFKVLTEYLPLFQTKHLNVIILHSTLREIGKASNIEYKNVMESIKHQFIFYNDYFTETNGDNITRKGDEYYAENNIKNESSISNENNIERISCNIDIKNVVEDNRSIDVNDDTLEKYYNCLKNSTEQIANDSGANLKLTNDFKKLTISKTDFNDNIEHNKFTKVIDYYRIHIPSIQIIILTSSNIYKLPEYHQYPSLISDLITKIQTEKTCYTEYYPLPILRSMEKAQKVYRGILYTNHTDCYSGFLHIKYEGQNIRIKINNKNDMNRAINTDGVFVEIVNEASTDINEIHGRVVGLFKRNFKNIVGSIDGTSINGSGPQNVLVMPIDRKYPKIRIRTSRVDELEGKRIVVRFNEWKLDSNYPFGSYVSIIGAVGDRKCEVDSIILSYGIDYVNYEEQCGMNSVIDTLKQRIQWHKSQVRNINDEVNNEDSDKIQDIIYENDRKTDKFADNKVTIENDLQNITKPLDENSNKRVRVNADEKIMEYKILNENQEEILMNLYKTVVDLEKNVRVDFRDCEVVSIDPPACTDIDDAMHCREINNLTEIGIHIADVSFFVEQGSFLDKEALNRGTTVYLTDMRYEMLPSFLSANLCSLLENEDRLTFTVLLYFDTNLDLVNTKFKKGIIRSKRSFTYEQAQEELNNGSKIFKGLFRLNEISKHLRKRRIQTGALELSSTELKIQIKQNEDSKSSIENVKQKTLFETNNLVEEFMLIANIEVAKYIYSRNKDSSLLRRHPKFADDAFDELKLYLKKHKIDLNYLTSRELNDSIQKIEDTEFKNIIKKIITRSMNQATYFSSGTFPYNDYLHYGLSVPIYTHFTSPIRRYADLIVHRQLYESFMNLNTFTCDRVTNICQQINMRNKNAMRASFDCDRYFIYLYIKNQGRLTLKAFIVKVAIDCMTLYVPELEVEESVTVDCDYVYRDGAYFMNDERKYGLYDWVMVCLKENDDMYYSKRQFDVEIVK